VSQAPGDRTRVRELLGREPRGHYEVVVRDTDGDPVVLRNAPFLDDGTPMPTRYWLIGPDEHRRIGRLEADGGVDEAEAAVDAAELAAAHARYAAERDAEIPSDHVGPRPTGGVGGTRVGVKCLHAHWAWHLAGGDDPVGRWIEARLADAEPPPPEHPRVDVAGSTITVNLTDGTRHSIPWGAETLAARWLVERDPPHPEDLTNALGTVTDHLDDLVREHPEVLGIDELDWTGETITSLARVEIGADEVDEVVVLERDDAEEIFRMVATDRAADRAFHPGLPSDHVTSIVATCCIVLSFLRRLHLDHATLHTTTHAATHTTTHTATHPTTHAATHTTTHTTTSHRPGA
jgi:hypothetical protein